MVVKVADHSDNMFKEDAKGVPCSSSLLSGYWEPQGLGLGMFFLLFKTNKSTTFN